MGRSATTTAAAAAAAEAEAAGEGWRCESSEEERSDAEYGEALISQLCSDMKCTCRAGLTPDAGADADAEVVEAGAGAGAGAGIGVGGMESVLELDVRVVGGAGVMGVEGTGVADVVLVVVDAGMKGGGECCEGRVAGT